MKELKNVMTFEQFSSQETEVIDEKNIIDFFKGTRGLVSKALKNTKDVANIDQAISSAFARQFGKSPDFKEKILGLPLETKVELVQLASDRLKDPKIGSLTLKNSNGKWLVLGSQVAGGAGSVVAG